MTKQILKMFLIKITNNMYIQKKQLYSINCNLSNSKTSAQSRRKIWQFQKCRGSPPTATRNKIDTSRFAIDTIYLFFYTLCVATSNCIGRQSLPTVGCSIRTSLRYVWSLTRCFKNKYIVSMALVNSNTVAQRRGFIYFIFERLRGDRRRNCMSLANNSF